MERRRRTYTHKGKVRFKRRLPRKLKKLRKKQNKIEWDLREHRLRGYMVTTGHITLSSAVRFNFFEPIRSYDVVASSGFR
jgi:hypothetical protein